MTRLVCSPGLQQRAGVLCEKFGFEFAGVGEIAALPGDGYNLYLDDRGLQLCQTGKHAPGPIRCDFAAGSARHRRIYGGGKSQSISRAVGIKNNIRPDVLDITAGLGGDAFVLASLGCRVTMVERNALACALLEDGLTRGKTAAEADADLNRIIGHLTLHFADAGQWLAALDPAAGPQVVYLDPMFPERKKSARVNKTMEAFQQLIGDDRDADDLLPLALSVARNRVVVKRPLQAPWLNGEKPGYSLKGKSVRFDVYPLKALDRV